MLKQRATIFRRLMMAADLAIAAGAFYLAYYTIAFDLITFVADRPLCAINELTWFLVLFVASWSLTMYFSGMYASFRLKKISEVAFLIYQSAYFSFFIFAAVCYALKIRHISRLFVALSFLYAMVLFLIEKTLLMEFLRSLRRKGFNYRNILIAGTGEEALHFIHWMDANKEFGLKITGLVGAKKSDVGQELAGHKVIGTFEDISRIERELALDSVLFAVPYAQFASIGEPMHYLETVGVKVDVALDYFKHRLGRVKQTELCGVPLLSFETAPENPLPLFTKRVFDVVISGIALVILSPLFLVTALLIRLTSKGPVLFVQERGSLHGRKFRLYKFRTMVEGAESQLEELKKYNEMNGAAFKMANDPRVTPLGKVLRKWSIDELPQLWNVFKGDMSLVGPRPPLMSEVRAYDDWQRRRLSMRPGITCLWQVRGRNKITDFAEWAKLDLEYIDNWSLFLDLRILLKTIPVVLFGIGAK
jgi:exopolysaccharide biosynthesis polyprenyl glycosylphosphotransferase